MEFSFRHTVNYYETDRMGVTHHSNYIRFMEEARVAFLDEIGLSFAKVEADGIVSPVVSLTCDYKSPSTFSDPIDIQVNVMDMTAVKVRFAYTMKVGEKTVCTASSLHCFLDAKTGRPIKYLERYPGLEDTLKSYMLQK